MVGIAEDMRELDWKIAPIFWQGPGAKSSLGRYEETTHGNEFLNRYTHDESSNVNIGSSVLMNSRLDSLIAPSGIRVADLDDLYKPEVRAMLDGRFYSDPVAFALRGSKNKGYERNTPVINQLVEMVEDANGKVEFPLLIRGFDVQPIEEEDGGYKLRIVKRDDFSARHDRRLGGENHGKKFNVLKDSLPDFTDGGKYTFYANDNATLSRLIVDSGGDLDTDDDFVDDSYDFGRVVLIPAEGAAEILESRFGDLSKERDRQILEVDAWYENAMKSAPVKR